MLVASVEEWRDIPGYEGSYQVSDMGRVKSLARNITGQGIRRERVLKLTPHPTQGRLQVGLWMNSKIKLFKVHRLVALAFVPFRAGSGHVNHKNGDKTDNRSSNLEWVTPSENHIHARCHGLTFGFPEVRVKQISTSTGEVVRIFDSMSSAARSIGVKGGAQNISRAAREMNRTAYGYKWETVQC